MAQAWTGPVNHHSARGNLFRVRAGAVCGRVHKHACPTCRTIVESSKSSTRPPRAKHVAATDGRLRLQLRACSNKQRPRQSIKAGKKNVNLEGEAQTNFRPSERWTHWLETAWHRRLSHQTTAKKILTCLLEFQKTSQPCASTYTFRAAQTLDSPA